MTAGMYDPAARNGDSAAWYGVVSKGQTPPSDNAAEMYDAILAYASAVQSTGGTDPDKISEYLTNLKDFKGWNGHQHGHRSVHLQPDHPPVPARPVHGPGQG